VPESWFDSHHRICPFLLRTGLPFFRGRRLPVYRHGEIREWQAGELLTAMMLAITSFRFENIKALPGCFSASVSANNMTVNGPI
jgi:hypothetical protein